MPDIFAVASSIVARSAAPGDPNCRHPRYSESGGRLTLYHGLVLVGWMYPVRWALCVSVTRGHDWCPR